MDSFKLCLLIIFFSLMIFRTLPLHLTFQPLSLFRWQLYTAQAMRSRWTSILGQDLMEESEDDQDYMKEALLETSPILLGLTFVVSIVHSIFEFLAFKNGKFKCDIVM